MHHDMPYGLKPFARISVLPHYEWLTYSQQEFDYTLRAVRSSHPNASVIVEWGPVAREQLDKPFRASKKDIAEILAELEIPYKKLSNRGGSCCFSVYIDSMARGVTGWNRSTFSLDELRDMEARLLSLHRDVVSADVRIGSWIRHAGANPGMILEFELGYAS